VPLDPDARAYLATLAGVPPLREIGAQEARRRYAATAAELFGPTDAVGSVVDQAIPGPVRTRVYQPPGPEAGHPVFVYYHGGGWVLGDLDTHDGVCRALCARTPCVVVAVDYRRAPEHRFPAALDDAWAATAWVAEHAASVGGDPARIAVGGDSAGGALAAAVTFRARALGLPLAFQLLVYPITDAALGTRSYEENATGYGLTRENMAWFWEQYLGPDADPFDPEVSPLRQGDLSGLPPACVVTVEFDPLRDEGEAYAARLEAAGVPVVLSRHEGLIHGVLGRPGAIPRGRELLDEGAAALRGALVAAGAQSSSS